MAVADAKLPAVAFKASAATENDNKPSASSMMHPLMTRQTPRVMPPIMRHVLPDEPNLDEMPSNFHPVQISHAVTLFTDPHSKDLTKRHLHILQKIVNEYKDGFFLRDLVDILIIVNACADRSGEDSRYIAPMIQVIKIAAKPFKKEKLSDDVAYKAVLKDTYAQLAFLLRIDDEDLQLQVCQTLLSVYQGSPEFAQSGKSNRRDESEDVRNRPDEPQRVPVEYSRYMLELSCVADTLVKALSLLQSPKVINVLFQILRLLTTKSAVNCDLVLSCGGAFTICLGLPTIEDAIERGLYLSSEILWNLLEYGDTRAVTKQISNQPCMRALQETFSAEVPRTYSQHHRTVRNDLLAIINIIARTDPMGPFIEAGIARSVLTLFSFTETKNIYSLTKHLRFSECDEDFEFKRMLLAVIMNLSENPSVLPLMREYKLLPAMLYYIKPVPEKDPTWLSSQFEEIQLQVLAALPKLLPQLLEDLVVLGCIAQLCSFLDWSLSPNSSFKGHGNSVYGEGGRGSTLAQAKYTLRVLRKIISFDDDQIVEGLLNAELHVKFLEELTRLIVIMENTVVHEFTPQAASVSPDAFINLEMTCDILYTLASMMGSGDRKEVLGKDGVEIVNRVLKISPKKVCLGLGYSKLILAALETIWSCVCGSYSNECYFLEMEGAFTLLDLLQDKVNLSTIKYEKSVVAKEENFKSVILGCLLDLLENPKTLHHVMTWTGKNDLKIGKLLINLWQQETSDATHALGDDPNKRMFIDDPENPLGTTQNLVSPRPSTDMSPSIAQVSLDLKPKIFGIFTKIGFNELPGLSATDYIWIAMIERYLDFKMGEVWNEICEELAQESIQPIGQDKQALEAITRISRDRAVGTKSYQESLFEAFDQQENSDENVAYSEIKAFRKQQDKLKTDFKAYVERTSNIEALKRARQEQKSSIANSRSNNALMTNPFFHVTSVDNINTTVFAARKVTSDNLPLVLDDQKSPQKQPTTAASSRRAAFFNTKQETAELN